MKNNILHKIKKIIKKQWIDNGDGNYFTTSDKSVVTVLSTTGIQVPMKIGKSVFIAKVVHDTSFNLLLMMYTPTDGDSGWVGLYIEQFLTKNKVNLATFTDFDTAEMCYKIGEQAAEIARNKNLPISIGTIFDGDFAGVVETESIINSVIPSMNNNRN